MRLRLQSLLSLLFLALCLVPASFAQQTLGRMGGTVTDSTGAVVPGVEVTLTSPGTGVTRTVKTRANGEFGFDNLAVGLYTVSFTRDGFDTAKFDSVQVQADRTVTLDPKLKAGSVSTSIDVTGTPMLNTVDTTNGYVLDSQQIANTPLATGSFTQLAVLSPGVNADLLSGTGTNTGLGNQNIWANGQRLSSNTFTFNGVLANNLFNGASSSQVAANRAVLNTGESFQSGGTIRTNTSIFDAIGEALPTPPQETISEMRVNTSMFDAAQGATAGAHIDVTTKSGTNKFHGSAYGDLGLGALNANEFFYNQAGLPRPDLTRFDLGATLGGPIKTNKLFFFVSYQHTHAVDQLNSLTSYNVPAGITDDRSASGLAAVVTNAGLAAGTPIDPVALAYLQAKAPDGTLLIRSPENSTVNDSVNFTGPNSTFFADRINGNLDYNISGSDTLSAKYYYQRDPTSSPFSSTPLLGFPQTFQSGSQEMSLENNKIFTPTLSWEQKLGFLRMNVGSYTGQPFGPSAVGINLFGSPSLPGLDIGNIDGNFNSLAVGPTSNFANTGFAQNTFEGTTTLNWVKGNHTLSVGANYDFTQLNILNRATNVAYLQYRSLKNFLTGGPLRTGASHSVYFEGASNRYYRSPQIGTYLQDKWRATSKLIVTAGIRYDDDGGLYEKNGNMVNFDPSKYSYDLTSDTINNAGLIIAGNNKQFHTASATNSTLTQRQWGIGPRVGFAYSATPNVVIRSGFGLYYDRGEFFTEFSPSAGGGFNGPFGVTLQPPFVQAVYANSSATSENPFGTTRPVVSTDPTTFINNLPNQAALINGDSPYLFGAYNLNNKLPYTENWSVDVQWQVRPDITVSAGYTGNHGVHQVIPIPFNQPKIATASNPVNGQTATYGWNATDVYGNALLSEPYATSTGGNTDLRAPYIGYSPNSVSWTANGIADYNALLLSANKSLKHGLDFSLSYTWSHSLDESSGYGLFYNGNDPRNLRSGYASSDFDRTHVTTLSFDYLLPNTHMSSGFAKRATSGFGLTGIVVLESGQPYNVYDYSGTVGSIYFSSNDYLTNPVLPLAPGVTPKKALTGHSGAFVNGAAGNADIAYLPSSFAYPLLQPGQDGVPACGPTTGGTTACDNYESGFSTGGRNIFRGSFQKRADLSIFKETKFGDRYDLRLSMDVFNVTNTPSFDTPGNNFTGDPNFAPYPFGTSSTPQTLGFTPLGPGSDPGNFSSQGTGVVTNPIGSPRQIQFDARFAF